MNFQDGMHPPKRLDQDIEFEHLLSNQNFLFKGIPFFRVLFCIYVLCFDKLSRILHLAKSCKVLIQAILNGIRVAESKWNPYKNIKDFNRIDKHLFICTSKTSKPGKNSYWRLKVPEMLVYYIYPVLLFCYILKS